MTLAKFVAIAINNSTRRDGYYMERNNFRALRPIFALYKWLSRELPK